MIFTRLLLDVIPESGHITEDYIFVLYNMTLFWSKELNLSSEFFTTWNPDILVLSHTHEAAKILRQYLNSFLYLICVKLSAPIYWAILCVFVSPVVN